jgi:hypothetical protein
LVPHAYVLSKRRRREEEKRGGEERRRREEEEASVSNARCIYTRVSVNTHKGFA